MQLFWLVVIFVFGSIVGSFLNVCIYRLPREKSLWNPCRSYCPHCHERIAWYDNIPLVSYFLLRAQCRHCGSSIAPRYVIVECLTASLFTLIYAALSNRGEHLPVTAVYMALVGLLVMGSFIDIELRIIPNSLTIGGMLLAPVLSVLVPKLHNYAAFGRTYVYFSGDTLLGPLAASLVGMIVGAAATWFAGVAGRLLFRREAMGFGDVKLMALLGGLLGWQQVLLIFFIAAFVGAIVGLIHLARTGEHHIPYVPFISVAAVAVMLWADLFFQHVLIAR